jgi:hypothetical protein
MTAGRKGATALKTAASTFYTMKILGYCPCTEETRAGAKLVLEKVCREALKTPLPMAGRRRAREVAAQMPT